MLPHRPVDDTDSDRTLLTIAARSSSLRIEAIVNKYIVSLACVAILISVKRELLFTKMQKKQ
jgi:hypothetical protein